MELSIRRFDEPDDERAMALGRFDLVRLGGTTVARASYQPGWKWSEHVGPGLGQTTCPVEHVGLVVSGRNRVTMDDGTVFDTETIVWTAGVKPNPMVARTDLPLDDKGRIKASAYLNVEGTMDAWTAGDCARVPDLTTKDGFTSPSAQHAVRQAKLLADNVAARLHGQSLTPYQHSYAGSVASLGLYKGVAQIYGVKVRGFPAWFMHRTYHMTRMPTFNRKVRVVLDWTLALFFHREIVSLGSFSNPRREFELAAAPAPAIGPGPGPAEDQNRRAG